MHIEIHRRDGGQQDTTYALLPSSELTKLELSAEMNYLYGAIVRGINPNCGTLAIIVEPALGYTFTPAMQSALEDFARQAVLNVFAPATAEKEPRTSHAPSATTTE